MFCFVLFWHNLNVKFVNQCVVCMRLRLTVTVTPSSTSLGIEILRAVIEALFFFPHSWKCVPYLLSDTVVLKTQIISLAISNSFQKMLEPNPEFNSVSISCSGTFFSARWNDLVDHNVRFLHRPVKCTTTQQLWCVETHPMEICVSRRVGGVRDSHCDWLKGVWLQITFIIRKERLLVLSGSLRLSSILPLSPHQAPLLCLG